MYPELNRLKDVITHEVGTISEVDFVKGTFRALSFSAGHVKDVLSDLSSTIAMKGKAF